MVDETPSIYLKVTASVVARGPGLLWLGEEKDDTLTQELQAAGYGSPQGHPPRVPVGLSSQGGRGHWLGQKEKWLLLKFTS